MIVERGDARLSVVDQGSGPAVLLLAPGGLRSSVSWWERAPWNPIEHLSGTHRVIAMDQRNAGDSTAPVTGDEGWDTYADDQLAVLDHLGVEEFAVLGMCIGGPFALTLAQRAPDRLRAAVVLQTIGRDGNRVAFDDSFRSWIGEQAPAHPEAHEEQWARYHRAMYGSDHTLFSVPDAELPSITTPLLVLPGDDLHHPASASRLLATLPGAEVVERWKEPADQPAAREAIERFL
ncbi:alpha/beta fold hydrolase [Pseudonocardia abyssalis]|uniref:Alpha/beta fold hydrolase n=1 Tax=Pseudonocardia abyssalis TaxID=2792008 RepID=A0ABS6UZ36_9PSEU|nr:alpha/beta hydrolase family protein [Pseudonocardia abyssalis]MBW0116616.1 alpha/beta fold hydrolase [Pseudonocardia abyssalis]MBW0137530.1 alpha/beta fold hydrolase [Pseudonocardia abyssalis]